MIRCKKAKLFCISIFILYGLYSNAQDRPNKEMPEKYRAIHWGIQDGLSHPSVYHMLKDANGFLWTGTQGSLCRFDGYEFKKYYYDPLKTGNINAKMTFGGLVEDSLHNIWVGTEKDLYRYDIKADTFTRFIQANPMLATRDELIGIEPGGSIFSYNIHSLAKKKLVSLSPTDSIWAGLNLFYSFYDARSNSLWMLRGDHANNRWSGGGLLQIDLTTGKKKQYGWSCYKNISRHDHSAEAMCYDRKRNCLWINSSEGLMQFTLDDQKFHFTGALNRFFNTKEYGRWVGIAMDLQDRIWLATKPKGIIIYDPSDHTVTSPFEQDSTLQKEISDANACIYSDRDGIVWSGYWLGKGIYQMVPFSPSVVHYKTNVSQNSFGIGSIENFQNIGNGKLWIGSNDGKHRIFDTYSGIIEALQEKDLPPDLRQTAILPGFIDTISKKAYLFCFDKGHWVYDMNTKNGQRLIFKDSVYHEINITSRGGFRPFKDGLLISGLFDKKQRIFFVKSGSMEANEVLSFPFNPGKVFWLEMANEHYMFLRGSIETGNLTYIFNSNKWIRRVNPLDSILWNHIIYNKKDQSYWVVSEKQLIKYSSDFKVLHVYTPAEGLPDIDILSLIPDSKGNIWFNTDRSIHQLNIETGVFSTLSEKDGFLPQNFTGGPALYMGPDGELYLGGGVDGDGFIRIRPDKNTLTSSSVYLRSLEINQKPFPMSTGVNELKELSLNYFQNKINIETGIIDYYSKGRGHIRYKLIGLNDTWQYAPAYYTIRYDGLKPGNYTLLMQASNASNEFIGPVKQLLINISSPWWLTWWAYASYIILVGLAIYTFIRWRTTSLQKEKIILEEKVNHRTTELNQSLENLKATQSQLIQSEKMASLGELTAGIAHEIQNPLNFVNNFSELNGELVKEIKQELAIGNEQLAKGNTQSAISSWQQAGEIINDIESNSEKINHHGKRAESIVKGMLEHSRKSTGVKEPTDVNKLCDEFVRLSYHGLRAKDPKFNCDYKLDLDPNLPLVNVVSQDIGRVLLNIINNAFQACSEKSGSLKLESQDDYKPLVMLSTHFVASLRLPTGQAGLCEICIQDNGPGIPSHLKDKIFQPFFTTKPTGQGTGLGLSLAYDIVKAHSGEFNVESVEGQYATFKIILPI